MKSIVFDIGQHYNDVCLRTYANLSVCQAVSASLPPEFWFSPTANVHWAPFYEYSIGNYCEDNNLLLSIQQSKFASKNSHKYFEYNKIEEINLVAHAW